MANGVRATLLVAVLASLGGCLQPNAYPCHDSSQCTAGIASGVCLPIGFCAYPNDECPSKLEFGPAAGHGQAGECVPPDSLGSGGFSESASESPITSAASQADSSGGCGACDSPPSECWLDQGSCGASGCVYTPAPASTACELDDPCVTAARCDGAGTCVATEATACDDPPGPCFEDVGTCNADGTCSYAARDAGESCEDGDACTVEDTCDGAGTCTPGESCPGDNPCAPGNCIAGACDYSPLADGASCGANPADRCCGGSCVDISSDEANCGGCGVTCDSDDVCESVAATSDCELAPSATTGRCTCDGANADCELGQVCRTVTPYANRCTPNSSANCPGNTAIEVNFCPNYCVY